MSRYIVRGISQGERGSYFLTLSEKRRSGEKRSRKERWRSSDDWYPGDELQGPFDSRPLNFLIPMDAKTFAETGVFVGAEVELSLEVASELTR